MSVFIYANSFRVTSAEAEVAIEFQTNFPIVDGAGTVTGAEAVGEPIRVIIPRVLIPTLITAVSAPVPRKPKED